MINNFKQIRNLLSFPDKNSFYFLEIIKRRKENPDMEKHASLVRDFYIYSLEEFDKLEGKIISLCEENNARAYFRLNRRDAEKIAFQYNKRLAELLITGDFKNIPRSYASVVGEYSSDPDKTWVVDSDTKEGESFADFLSRCTTIEHWIKNISTHETPIMACLKTPNGLHIIARPFRLDAFKMEFTDVEVHKDNPSILYAT